MPERVTDGIPELKWSMIVERDEKIAEQQQVIAALVGALKNVRANLRTVPITEPGWSELNAEIFKAAELADALLADHSAAAEAWAAHVRDNEKAMEAMRRRLEMPGLIPRMEE